ncbi:hypothetical protein [Rubritalea tangerina]
MMTRSTKPSIVISPQNTPFDKDAHPNKGSTTRSIKTLGIPTDANGMQIK